MATSENTNDAPATDAPSEDSKNRNAKAIPHWSFANSTRRQPPASGSFQPAYWRFDTLT
jgi:hypothetical protein